LASRRRVTRVAKCATLTLIRILPGIPYLIINHRGCGDPLVRLGEKSSLLRRRVCSARITAKYHMVLAFSALIESTTRALCVCFNDGQRSGSEPATATIQSCYYSGG
jgi:hypothetical protein